jgi:hypothetical protein
MPGKMLASALALSASLASAAPSAAPCDIFNSAATPCSAAHSTVRALFAGYNGPLYQVMKGFGTPSNSTQDIPVLSAGGYANSAVQDAFCGGADCVISRLYDQSPMHNHLDTSPPGGAWKHQGLPVNATRNKVVINGHAVYGAFFETKMGYRRDLTQGIAKGNEEETLYMVTSGLPEHVNGGCCFDYGVCAFSLLNWLRLSVLPSRFPLSTLAL